MFDQEVGQTKESLDVFNIRSEEAQKHLPICQTEFNYADRTHRSQLFSNCFVMILINGPISTSDFKQCVMKLYKSCLL